MYSNEPYKASFLGFHWVKRFFNSFLEVFKGVVSEIFDHFNGQVCECSSDDMNTEGVNPVEPSILLFLFTCIGIQNVLK